MSTKKQLTQPAAKKAAAKSVPAAKTAKASAKSPVSSGIEGALDALGASQLGGGIDALFAQTDAPEFMVNLDDIDIVDQVRTEFEDDTQDLASLGKSLRKYQIQAILLRINPHGSAKPYTLCAGERRVRGARIEGLTELRAKAREMTDEEFDSFQFAENVHRKNLTQIEEAKRIQADLAELGTVEAVLAKHNKSNAWLSKILSLLHLPEQTKRLVTENVSADLEVINNVKQVEKVDPKAAQELVNELKKDKGKTNARAKTQEAKEKAKPSKKTAAKGAKQPAPGKGENKDIFADAKIEGGEAGHSDTQPASGESGQASAVPAGLTPRQKLSAAYDAIFERRSNPTAVADAMNEAEREAVTDHLMSFYAAGKQSKDTGRAVIQGFRTGQFSTDGDGAFSLVAFLQGADSDATFSLVNVLGAVKE